MSLFLVGCAHKHIRVNWFMLDDTRNKKTLWLFVYDDGHIEFDCSTWEDHNKNFYIQHSDGKIKRQEKDGTWTTVEKY